MTESITACVILLPCLIVMAAALLWTLGYFETAEEDDDYDGYYPV